MQNELEILKWIDNTENITQRDIAQKIGISLGNVNTLINKLIKDETLKIEKISSRVVKYIITAKGQKIKAEQMYNDIVSSCKLIREFNSKVEDFFTNRKRFKADQYLLYGTEDELYEPIKDKLIKINIPYVCIGVYDELKKMIDNYDENIENDKQSEILVWHPEIIEALNRKGIKFINLLELFGRLL